MSESHADFNLSADDYIPALLVDKEGNKEWVLPCGLLHREDGPAVERINTLETGSYRLRAWYRYGQLHREDGAAIEYMGGGKEWWVKGKRLTEDEFKRRCEEQARIPEKLRQAQNVTELEALTHKGINQAITLSSGTLKPVTKGSPSAAFNDSKQQYAASSQKTAVLASHTEEQLNETLETAGQDMWSLSACLNKPTPTVYNNGTKHWLLHGKMHREDGPAVEDANGSYEWRINNQFHREDGPAFESSDGSRHWYRHGKRHREDGPAIEQADGTASWFLEGSEVTEDQFKAWCEERAAAQRADIMAYRTGLDNAIPVSPVPLKLSPPRR